MVIAGFGLLSPLGQSAWETFSALLAGRSIADRCAELPPDVAPVDLVRAVGAVKLAQHTATDPAVELAERAAREAASMAGLATDGLETFIGTSKGAIGAMIDDPRRPADTPIPPRLAEAVTLGPCGYLNHHLRNRLRLGSTRHYVAACASGLTALHHARQHLLHTPLRTSEPTEGRMTLVLAAESALHPLFIHSYRRLGVLADPTPDGYRQRPLDERRRGFMLGEFGAALLLRRLDPGESPRPGELELVATATAAEAGDLIRPSPTMPALGHVARTLFAAAPPIDVLHPHAPGTPDHDPAELATLLAELTRQPAPDVYACKGALGHGLGAAGLVSLVLACVSLTAGKRPPMPWLERPMPLDRPPSPASGEGQAIPGDRLGNGYQGKSNPHPNPLLEPEKGPDNLAAAHPCSRTGTHAVFAAGFGSHVAGAVVRRW